MLLAGCEVRMVKNCDRGLENAARGRLSWGDVRDWFWLLTKGGIQSLKY